MKSLFNTNVILTGVGLQTCSSAFIVYDNSTTLKVMGGGEITAKTDFFLCNAKSVRKHVL